MSMIVEHCEEVVVIRIVGAFDFKLQRVFRQTYEGLPTDQPVQIDLGGVVHIDSSALGMLLLVREHLGGDRSAIALRNCTPEIRNLLRVARFESLFTILNPVRGGGRRG